jgi:hypothetical protein
MWPGNTANVTTLPPKNAAVAPSVVQRRLEFRRNYHEIKDL